MAGALASFSALFFGIALMMMGNGLQGSLLGLRASIENFDTAVLGVVMSGYFVGFLAGSLYAPRVVAKVGHIRVFAALASLASISILVHSVFIDPWVWGAMRVITGFCYAGLYIVAESWLNDMSDNANRGRLLSIYMVVQLGAVAGGQFLLGLADPSGANLFMLIAVLVSLAVLPLCLSASKTPDFSTPEAMGFRELFRLSPLGSLGMVLSGVANGVIFGFGAVYAQRAGLTVNEIATFVAAMFLGGMVLQWPIGRMSDRIDRRVVILAVTIGAAVVAAVAAMLPEPAPLSMQPGGEVRVIWPIMAAAAVFGGLSIPHYSLFTAHVNDRVPARKMVAASSALVFLHGVGAIAGPNLAALIMGRAGPSGFFITLAGVHAVIGLLAGYRMLRRSAPAPVDQSDFVAMPLRATQIASQMPDGWGPDDVEDASDDDSEPAISMPDDGETMHEQGPANV
ncbi:MAG: MFS transporter [Minwuia sp.]|uniref:MFS transporter n=1 Tax=Minwuia sp. TaxID=2493630 RepID=UPI003A89D788